MPLASTSLTPSDIKSVEYPLAATAPTTSYAAAAFDVVTATDQAPELGSADDGKQVSASLLLLLLLLLLLPCIPPFRTLICLDGVSGECLNR